MKLKSHLFLLCFLICFLIFCNLPTTDEQALKANQMVNKTLAVEPENKDVSLFMLYVRFLRDDKLTILEYFIIHSYFTLSYDS